MARTTDVRARWVKGKLAQLVEADADALAEAAAILHLRLALGLAAACRRTYAAPSAATAVAPAAATIATPTADNAEVDAEAGEEAGEEQTEEVASAAPAAALSLDYEQNLDRGHIWEVTKFGSINPYLFYGCIFVLDAVSFMNRMVTFLGTRYVSTFEHLT